MTNFESSQYTDVSAYVQHLSYTEVAPNVQYTALEHLKVSGVNVLLYHTAHFHSDTPSNPLWQTGQERHRNEEKPET
jgi:hypothetical protein